MFSSYTILWNCAKGIIKNRYKDGMANVLGELLLQIQA